MLAAYPSTALESLDVNVPCSKVFIVFAAWRELLRDHDIARLMLPSQMRAHILPTKAAPALNSSP
jgi:hypothetical protein